MKPPQMAPLFWRNYWTLGTISFANGNIRDQLNLTLQTYHNFTSAGLPTAEREIRGTFRRGSRGRRRPLCRSRAAPWWGTTHSLPEAPGFLLFWRTEIFIPDIQSLCFVTDNSSTSHHLRLPRALDRLHDGTNIPKTKDILTSCTCQFYKTSISPAFLELTFYQKRMECLSN